MRRLLVAAIAAIGSTAGATPAHAQDRASCSDTATPSTVVAKAAGAPSDTVLCLQAGAYGQRSFTAKRTGMITLRPADGATVTINPTISGAGYRFDGLTLTGAYLNGARETEIVNSRITGMVRVDTPKGSEGAGVLFDRDTFDGINGCSACYEGRLTVRGYDNTAPVGVKVTNSHFGGGGSSDGVQIVGAAYGVEIGPGNEFEDITQAGALNGAHVDPIQLYGSRHTRIVGNYLHDNSTGIMAPNGGDAETITGNVIVMSEYPYAVYGGYQPGLVVTHNTFVGGSLHLEDWSGGSGGRTSATVRDNVFAGGIDKIRLAAGAVTQDYNLLSSGASGSHDVTGQPRFAGGSGLASYRLSPLSPGSAAASDGSDMGAPLGAIPTPTPTPSPTVSPTPTATPSPTSTATPPPTPTPDVSACAPTCDSQIAALQKANDTLQGRVSDLEQTIAQLRAKVAAAIAALQ